VFTFLQGFVNCSLQIALPCLHLVQCCGNSIVTVGTQCSLLVQECKKAGVNFIAPEHILLAMLSMHDSNGRRVFERCAARVVPAMLVMPAWIQVGLLLRRQDLVKIWV
jgi:hypothetical protein